MPWEEPTGSRGLDGLRTTQEYAAEDRQGQHNDRCRCKQDGAQTLRRGSLSMETVQVSQSDLVSGAGMVLELDDGVLALSESSGDAVRHAH